MKRSIAAVLLFAACNSEPQKTTTVDNSFETETQKWQENRRTRLMSDTGWLTLVGLEWLQEGINEITLPTKPPVTRRFVLDKGKVNMDGAPLLDDLDAQGPSVMREGTLSFQVIKRADKGADRFGVRMRDTASPSRTAFKGLEYFPPDPSYRVEATFEPYQPAKKIAITNVLGMTSDETAPGALVFNLRGKTYRLEPILEQGETDLFIIFKDETSGKETYPAARYVYAAPPDAKGKTFIDFNRAYNPPCAFTEYATCPLPPPQNRLATRIEAGEKNYAGAH